MLVSAATGIWLGASLDTYKRFTGSSRRFRWTLIYNDILFWLLQGLIFFYVLLQVNHGEVRFYLFLALLLGYSVYRSLFEKVYKQMLEWMIGFIYRTFMIVIRIFQVLIINPLYWILKIVLTLSMIIVTAIWNILNYLILFLTFPVRWLVRKYLKAYGIPFHSSFKRIASVSKRLKVKWQNLFKRHDK